MIYVAELSINHLGMLNIAKAMIKAAKPGADYVKIKIKKLTNIIQKNQKVGEDITLSIIERALN